MELGLSLSRSEECRYTGSAGESEPAYQLGALTQIPYAAIGAVLAFISLLVLGFALA